MATTKTENEFQLVPTRKAATIEPLVAAVLLDTYNGFEVKPGINPETHSDSELLQSIALGATSHPPNT